MDIYAQADALSLGISVILQGVADQASESFYDVLPGWIQVVLGAAFVLLQLLTVVVGIVASVRVNRAAETKQSSLEEQARVWREESDALKERTERIKDVALSQRFIDAVARPAIEGRLNQNIILRFLILYIVLTIWGLFDRLYSTLTANIYNVFMQQVDFDSSARLFGTLAYTFMSLLPIIGVAIIIIVFGWPLLKDVTKALGLRPRDLLRFRPAQSLPQDTSESGRSEESD